jgi:uncharacterized repeat protein (TIGR01451 family)
MPVQFRPCGIDGLRPKSEALALEPRIMFDGAAAAAADPHHADAPADATHPHAAPTETPAAATAPRTLLVVDSRLEDAAVHSARPQPGVTVLVVDSRTDGVAAITQALAQLGTVDSIQILSHGAPGQFMVGDRLISSDTVDALGSSLAAWRTSLSQGADILLYGCNVGAGASGQALVHDLAHWTGADVAASSNDTGNPGAGGDWTLEVTDGPIEHGLALSAATRADVHGLLVDASPTVTLSSAGQDVLLGGQVTFTASFRNGAVQDGYAPYIDLFLPATGRDGNDGLTFVSATYLGQRIVTYAVTFDASGNAIHPLAKDASGNALVIHASDYGLRPGDQLVVLQVPYAGISASQPFVDIQVTAQLSNLADTAFSNGTPDLTVQARGGFQLGNDSLYNPLVDPSIVEAGTHAFVVHPTMITLSQSFDAPEGKTVTGPNYPRHLTLTAAAAPGQTLTNVEIDQDLPADVVVTSITPGANGSVTVLVLTDGSVLTDAADIQAALATGASVARYTVRYTSLSGKVDTVVGVYVPEADATGAPVIDPVSGDAVTITVDGATASGQWVPLDPRDLVPPATTIALTGTGKPLTFLAESLAMYKSVLLQTDLGHAGLTPGDTLAYTLAIDISDYFAFGRSRLNTGQFIIRDAVGDGQLLNGVPTMSFSYNGTTRTIALVSVRIANADGTTSLIFDIGQSLANANPLFGGLAGDLAFDALLQGATTATISYTATVAQAYTTTYPQSEINEGDSLSNNAVVVASVLQDATNTTGALQTDSDGRTGTVPTGAVDIAIASVNGTTPPANGELRPGDQVTFTLSYDLVTGDYEQFVLTGYLPLPLFDLTGIAWTQGNGVGQWHFGAGNTNPDGTVTVTNGAGNAIVLAFGNQALPGTTGTRIEVQFTVVVGDQPFADQRALSVLAQSDQLTTITQQHLQSSDAAIISSVAEPSVAMTHGVVSTTNGTVTGTLGTWAAPGTAGTPFTGTISNPLSVNGDITGFDGGDILRLATALENTGGGGAFDVVTSVTLPSGLSFVGGSLATANLHVYRGDGTALTLGVDYAVSGTTITFLDANGVATLQAGRTGTAADQTGANLIVITYDVVAAASIAAGSTLHSEGALTRYASVNGGTSFTQGVVEGAGEQVAAPTVTVVYAGGSLDNGDSSAASTQGSDVVIGESMLYDIVVTLPEGTSTSLRVDDLVPPGMYLDPSYNGTGYILITTVAGSGALSADFNGTITIQSVTGVGGTVGTDGVDGRMVFSVSTAAADNATGNNRFVIRVRLVTSNTLDNQAGRVLQDSAQLTYTDPDGDTAGGAALDRTVAATGGQPTVTVREPTIVITQTTDPLPPIGVDQTIPVTFQIVLTNGGASTDVDAFDIAFSDTLPTELSGLTLLGVTYSGNATNHGGADFVIVNGVLRTADGSNIDIPAGGSVVIRVTGVVNAAAASVPSFDNTATVAWTSMDGAIAGERTGNDGLLGSGVLNDYRASTTLTVPVLRGVYISRVGGLPDTAAANPTQGPSENVAIGEVVHYRTVGVFAQGQTDDYTVSVTLASGLGFIDDGSVRIGFVSNGGVSSNVALVTGGTLNINGDEDSAQVNPLLADLSGPGLSGVLSRAQVTVSTDANGNTVLTFHLGTITNADNDGNYELFAIEFNARVLNVASNVAGAALAVSATDRSAGTLLATSQTVNETIVEPRFSGLDKSVVDFVPNVTSGTGSVTVAIGFSQTGSQPAYDVLLTDAFPGGTGYTFTGLVIDGIVYGPGNLPPGVSVDTSNGIAVRFAQLNAGDTVRVTYQATVPDLLPTASSAATLTWSSLPASFTQWGGSSVGTAGSSLGERTGTGEAPNTYVLSEGAGLGVIAGTLWNDTFSATTSATPDGAVLAGQTVSLTWAGLDGNLATSADNRTFTTVTDASGHFSFGALPAGVFRIDVPIDAANVPQPIGVLRVRIDSDANSPLGQVVVSLGEGAQGLADAGYVHQNIAPVNTVPGTQSGLEDIPLALTPLAIADADAGGGIMDVALSVLHGTLSLASPPAGVTVTGAGTARLTLSGTIADVNLALAQLVYLGSANFNGNDTLTVVTGDRGNFGDANGDGLPGRAPDDTLTDTDTVAIVLAPVNDAPIGVDDHADATEAGGLANSQAGIDPRGNLLNNDIDVDIATNGDVLHITAARSGSTGPLVTVGPDDPSDVVGTYGTLRVLASGGFEYDIDNTNPAVEALRLAGQTLTEQFTYTFTDAAGLASSAVLTVVIHGANDTPVATDDAGDATEKGGVLNGSPGNDATGDVLANDTDVDSAANGETHTVTGVRGGSENDVASFASVAGGSSSAAGGTVIVGVHGTLTLGADGSYRYVVNDNDPAVGALIAGQSLSDLFSYVVTDAEGLSDIAQLRFTVHGANDNPVATDDAAVAQAASTDDATHESNPSGNVILNATRPGPVDQPGGNGVDYDTDGIDQPSSELRVDGATAGANASGVLPFVTSSGTLLTGLYGQLVIRADGSYAYDVDSDNANVAALSPGQTLTDTFTYEIVDHEGLTSRANLVITIRGAQDPPVAQDVFAAAVEAGGVNNATPGINPSGDATASAFDPDGDPLTVTGIRTGAEADTGTNGTVGTGLRGLHGTLTINADGSYTYVLDNSDPTVEALRSPLDTLQDRFTFTISDGQGDFDSATITIVIAGRNDNPVAHDDSADATEAGGVTNQQAGVDPTGNVLANDTDVDAGDTKTVTAVRTGAVAGAGTAGVLSSELRGTYGWLTLNADGTYTYRLDNTLAAVQALRLATDTLTDAFNYTMVDTAGAVGLASLRVVIHGANDAPVAIDDAAVAIEAGGVANATPGTDPTGDVLANDTDVDASGEALHILSVERDGAQALAGTSIVGAYGTLTLQADGTYLYVVDNQNGAVQALRTDSNTLTESFLYTIADLSGSTASATLTVTIHGRNDAPVASDDTASATEAGGVANGTPGAPGVGDLLVNDTDVDGSDTRTVSGIRTGVPTDGGAFTPVNASASVAGTYGHLSVLAGGGYIYIVDDASAVVQALTPGQIVTDTFTYTMVDAAGATSVAMLTVTVHGANDAPTATPVFASATEAGGIDNTTAGVDPSGNLLAGVTDPDAAGVPPTIATFAHGSVQTTPGNTVDGNYGSLRVAVDGSFTYVVDNTNAAVQALRQSGDHLVDLFVFTAVDRFGATVTSTLTVTIQGANDAPVAGDDIADAFEAGGVNNASPGVDPGGNLLRNDHDVDGASYGETASVVAVRTGAETGTGTAGTIGTELRGAYGWLLLQADGTASYRLDNTLPAVQALRSSSDTLTEQFTYTLADAAGATDQATITIVIHGADDAPVAVPDTAVAVEAGGVFNGTPGINPGGNVLANDSDVDGAAYGETLQVSGVAGAQGVGGAGSRVAGNFGYVVMGADGTWTYVVDNDNAAVQALRTPADELTEVFVYTVSDAAGQHAVSILTITILGRDDAPVAVDDAASVVEASGIDNGDAPPPPAGNVLANDTDVDAGDTHTVNGIRSGAEADGGTFTDVPGTLQLQGRYGILTINRSGAWQYQLDNTLPEVQGLLPGQSLVEVFTYRVVDTAGATDTAALRIDILGANDTPVAVDDQAVAVEAGGVNNATPGVNPVGNVLDNDTDVDAAARGETREVAGYTNANGIAALRGTALAGLYGSLVIDADGRYSYTLDNANPTVQALRTATDSLTEVFTYRTVDASGAVAEARLTIVIQGANDNPLAANDAGVAEDVDPAPQTHGHVLGNDTDVDAGDALTVVAVRPGARDADGTGTAPGGSLAGRYGTLLLNADGSYTYAIDMTNPDVLAAAGRGRFLQDVFTYTVADRAGATAMAELRIDLDIAAPYIPAPDYAGPNDNDAGRHGIPAAPLPDVTPAVYVGPAVEEALQFSRWLDTATDGSRPRAVLAARLSGSIGEGLGIVTGQYVGHAVAESRNAVELSTARLLGRHGRIALTADGRLPDPSVFALTPRGLAHGDFAGDTATARTARGFGEQLRGVRHHRPDHGR